VFPHTPDKVDTRRFLSRSTERAPEREAVRNVEEVLQPAKDAEPRSSTDSHWRARPAKARFTVPVVRVAERIACEPRQAVARAPRQSRQRE
jgi:hypothetical protein